MSRKEKEEGVSDSVRELATPAGIYGVLEGCRGYGRPPLTIRPCALCHHYEAPCPHVASLSADVSCVKYKLNPKLLDGVVLAGVKAALVKRQPDTTQVRAIRVLRTRFGDKKD